MSENSKVDEIIEQIVCTTLLGDEYYKKIEDKAKRKVKYDQQTEMIEDSINKACIKIEKSIPRGTHMPGIIRLEVANQMLHEVMHNPTVTIDGIKIDEKKIIKELQDTYINNERIGSNHQIYNDVETIVAIGIIQEKYQQGSQEEKDIIARAHSVNATQKDKDMYVALSEIDSTKFEMDIGLSFNALPEHQKGFKIKMIRTLVENGKIEEANAFMKEYNLTIEDVNDKQWDNYVYDDNTRNEADAEISRKINSFSEKLEKFVSNAPKVKPEEQRRKAFEKIMDEYNSSNIKIDFGLDAISRIAMNYEDRLQSPEMLEFIEKFIRDIEKPEEKFELDDYMTTRMITLVNKLNEVNPEYAKKIFDSFNKRAKQINYQTFDYNKICNLDNSSLRILYNDFNKIITGEKDGYDKLYEMVEQGKVFINTNDETQNKEEQVEEKNSKGIENNTDQKKIISIMNTLNGVYDKNGMKGVMKCMSVRCLDEDFPKFEKSDWIKAYTRFFDSEKFNQGISCADRDVILEQLKNIVKENSDKMTANSHLYQFVQVTNEVIKEQKEKTLLTAENVPAEQIFEQFSDGNELIEKNSQNRNKDLNDNEGPDSR